MLTKINKDVLNERFKKFTLEVVRFVKILPKTEENRIFGKQIIRSSSSVGANYAEAVFAQTKQEFIHCLKISRKEANETLYWLELIQASNPNQQTKIEPLIDECIQILKILISSVKTLVSK
jgi:four helix bundle protein